jgi:hypothetical protein
VIPKAADLLGPVDLVCDIDLAQNPPDTRVTFDDSEWNNKKGGMICTELVDEIGYAMIERITFSVGSNDIEHITGEQLQIINELMRSDECRHGKTILKTGSAGFRRESKVRQTDGQRLDELGGKLGVIYNAQAANGSGEAPNGTTGHTHADDPAVGGTLEGLGNIALNKSANGTAAIIADQNAIGRTRTLCFAAAGVAVEALTSKSTCSKVAHIKCAKKRIVVPLGLFFTKHPGQYFPLAAVAGCNDVRIQIKFRNDKELIRTVCQSKSVSGYMAGVTPGLKFGGGTGGETCKLRCHYVHVTGPEATTLMNKEHVRLLKLFSHNSSIMTQAPGSSDFAMDLSFLHPVVCLLITIRDNALVNATHGSIPATFNLDTAEANKGFFDYHGSGNTPPQLAHSFDDGTNKGAYTKKCLVESIRLNVNGQDRHSSLAAKGIDRQYLLDRIMPLMFSNTSTSYEDCLGAGGSLDYFSSGPSFIPFERLAAQLDRKEIYCFPFAINPEAHNPSGALNFSKISTTHPVRLTSARFRMRSSSLSGHKRLVPLPDGVLASNQLWTCTPCTTIGCRSRMAVLCCRSRKISVSMAYE